MAHYVRRLFAANLQRSLGVGGSMIGIGYWLSFDYPMSYISYGLCVSFEKLSDRLPGLRDRRQGVYDRASRFAERWRLESPFLNAFLLDRICREAVTRQHCLRITLDPLERPPIEAQKGRQEINQHPGGSVPVPSGNVVEEGGEAGAAVTADQPAVAVDAAATGLNVTTEEQSANLTQPSTPIQAMPSLMEKSKAAMDKWRASVSQRATETKSSLKRSLNLASIIGGCHDLLFPGAAKVPSFVSVLDRVHHLTITLEPHCTNVDRVRSVYLTLTNFLSSSIKQKAFHEQLFSEASLEHDKLLVQLFQLSLLSTLRMNYLREYEAAAVIPEPPAPLPIGGLDDYDSSMWKKAALKTTETVRGLVSSFGPNSSGTPRPKSGRRLFRDAGTTKQEAVVVRPSGWSAHEAVADGHRKLHVVWTIAKCSEAMRTAAKRIIWSGDIFQSRIESQLGGKPAEPALQKRIAQTLDDVTALSASIRLLLQEINRLPKTGEGEDLHKDLNFALQTPWTLSPFGNQFHRSAFGHVIHWAISGPLIPLLLGAGLSAIYFTTNPKDGGSVPLAQWIRNFISRWSQDPSPPLEEFGAIMPPAHEYYAPSFHQQSGETLGDLSGYHMLRTSDNMQYGGPPVFEHGSPIYHTEFGAGMPDYGAGMPYGVVPLPQYHTSTAPLHRGASPAQAI